MRRQDFLITRKSGNLRNHKFSPLLSREKEENMNTIKHTIPVLLAILFHSPCAFAGPTAISGHVTNSEGIPVPNVSISLIGSAAGTTTNSDGRFYLVPVSNTDSILISHSAYRTVKAAVSDDINKLVMEPKTYRFAPITITGNIYASDRLNIPVSHAVIPIHDAPAWGNSIAERLDKAGLQVKDYGGAAGLKTVTSPTGQSEHVLIMLEGLPLNSPQLGMFDLGTLPAELIGQAELFRGQGSSLYGSGAVGGTVNLAADDRPHSYIRSKSGSYGESGKSGKISLPAAGGKISLTGTSYKNLGDFRDNNDFAQDAAGLHIKIPLGELWSASYLGIWSNSERGLAGSETWLTPNARKYNKDLIQAASFRGLSVWGQTDISIGKFDSDEHYVDNNPDFPAESRHQVSSLRFRAFQRIFSSGGNQYIITSEGTEHRIESDNTGDQIERQAAVGLLSTFKPAAQTTISPSIRADWNSSQVEIVPTGSLALLHLFGGHLLKSLRVNMGASYRYPTINELHWTDAWGNSGNLDLQPEKGRSTSAELGLEPISSFLYAEIRVYHFYSENLIQWVNDENWIFSTQNIAKSESFGTSLQLNFLPGKLPIRASFRTEQNRSRILSTGIDQGKRLIYVPAVSHWFDLSWQTSRLKANLSYRFLGKRRYSYSSAEELKGYERWDASVRFVSPRIWGVIPVIEIGARNLTDRKDQQSVYGYPEPGRALFGQLTLKFR